MQAILTGGGARLQPMPLYKRGDRVFTPSGKGTVANCWWYGRSRQIGADTVPESWRYLVHIDGADRPVDFAEAVVQRLHEPPPAPVPEFPDVHRRIVRHGLLDTTSRIDPPPRFWPWVIALSAAVFLAFYLKGHLL